MSARTSVKQPVSRTQQTLRLLVSIHYTAGASAWMDGWSASIDWFGRDSRDGVTTTCTQH